MVDRDDLLNTVRPKIVIVISGKRKSGKDYITERLKFLFGEDMCTVLRLSAPLKARYAAEHGLDFKRLLDSSEYKEIVRKDMIQWGEEKRKTDYKYFCIIAVEEAYRTSGCKCYTTPLWIVSDARRSTDLKFFREQYYVVHVRIKANDSVRVSRGWIFNAGVDDAESECGLDLENFDLILENNGDERKLEEALTQFRNVLLNKLSHF